MPITSEAFIRIDEAQAVDALGRINAEVRRFASTAELAARKQLVDLSGFARPLQNVRLTRPIEQVNALQKQLQHLKGVSNNIHASMLKEQDALRAKFQASKLSAEELSAAFIKLRADTDTALSASGAQTKTLHDRMRAESYTDAFVPLEGGRGALAPLDELSNKEKELLDPTERARAGIAGLGAEILRMGERGTISAQGIQQLVTRLELLKTQGVAGTPEFAALNPKTAEAETRAIDGLGTSLVHMQDNLKRAGHEVRATEQELQGMPKVTAETTRTMMHLSSAAQGLLLGTSILQGNITSAAFAFVFMRFAIISTLVKVALLAVAFLSLIAGLKSFVSLMKASAGAVREFGKEAQQNANFFQSAKIATKIETFASHMARAFAVPREEGRKLGAELEKLDRHFGQLDQKTNFAGDGTGAIFADAAAALGIEAGDVASQFADLFTTVYDGADDANKAFTNFGKEFDIQVMGAVDSLTLLEALQERFIGSAAASAGQLDGEMLRLSATFEDFRIKVGAVLEKGLIPFIQVLRKFGDGLIAGFEGMVQAGLASGDLTDRVERFQAVVRRLAPMLHNLGQIVGTVLYRGMGALARITKSVISIFQAFWKTTKFLRDAIVGAWQSIKEKLGEVLPSLSIDDIEEGIIVTLEILSVEFKENTLPYLRDNLKEIIQAGIAGAGIGFLVGGLPGAFLGLLVGIGAQIAWDYFDSTQEAGPLFGIARTDLSDLLRLGIAGGGIGLILGGLPGMFVGFGVGIGISLLWNYSKAEGGEGPFSAAQSDLKDLLVPGILGAGIGLLAAGIPGMFLGFGIGLGASLLWTYIKQEGDESPFATLRGDLELLLIAGSIGAGVGLLVGGIPGAFVGLSVGMGVTLLWAHFRGEEKGDPFERVRSDLRALLVTGFVIGGGLGLMTGGFRGAFLGLAIAVSVGLIWSYFKSVEEDSPFAEVRGDLKLLLGAGFLGAGIGRLAAGSAKGAFVGFSITVGSLLVFTMEKELTDAVGEETYNEIRRQVGNIIASAVVGTIIGLSLGGVAGAKVGFKVGITVGALLSLTEMNIESLVTGENFGSLQKFVGNLIAGAMAGALIGAAVGSLGGPGGTAAGAALGFKIGISISIIATIADISFYDEAGGAISSAAGWLKDKALDVGLTIATGSAPIPETPRSTRNRPVQTPSTFGEPQRHAKGGLITQPTLSLLGENGPEVVTPLSGPRINFLPPTTDAGNTTIINIIVPEGAYITSSAINDLSDRVMERLGLVLSPQHSVGRAIPGR